MKSANANLCALGEWWWNVSGHGKDMATYFLVFLARTYFGTSKTWLIPANFNSGIGRCSNKVYIFKKELFSKKSNAFFDPTCSSS